MKSENLKVNRVYKLPLTFQAGHLFVTINKESWLIDTGAPKSLGRYEELPFCGKSFPLEKQMMGVTLDWVSRKLNFTVAGILGVDVMDTFDWMFNLSEGYVLVSLKSLSQKLMPRDSMKVDLNMVLGIPVLEAMVNGRNIRMYFDTGAKVSYLNVPELLQFPRENRVNDFHPMYEAFEVMTYRVRFFLGGVVKTFLKCGELPNRLVPLLSIGQAQGVIGNELLLDRQVLFSPRRKFMVLGNPTTLPVSRSLVGGLESEEADLDKKIAA